MGYVYISHTHSTYIFQHVANSMKDCVVSTMSIPKKFFDPVSKTFLIWNEQKEKWETEKTNSSNVDDLLYMTDYVTAEIQIENAIESQIVNKVLESENIFKKELRN
jgi:hypothetical protein